MKRSKRPSSSCTSNTPGSIGFAGVANGMMLLSFLAVSVSAFVAAVASHPPVTLHAADATADVVSLNACRSNSTHIGWIGNNGSGVFETMDEARVKMTKYLWDNIMPYDVRNAQTIGFDADALSSYEHCDSNAETGHQSVSRVMRQQSIIEGLSDGILNQTLHYSLQAKLLYPWTDVIPRPIYLEYVVPFAVVNEPRTDYRPLLFDALRESLKGYERSKDNRINIEGWTQTPQAQIKEVVKIINTRLWSILGRNSKPIVFQAVLTPRIYDPLSVIAHGHSSCTGLAILLIAALRSVGIAARMAGTPAWCGKKEIGGNHNWVEVFVPDDTGGQWLFLEPTPFPSANADDLDRDPCKRWFCTAERFNGSTKVFASRFTKDKAGAFYPMSWAVGDDGVPGEDRSKYYTSICGECKT